MLINQTLFLLIFFSKIIISKLNVEFNYNYFLYLKKDFYIYKYKVV